MDLWLISSAHIATVNRAFFRIVSDPQIRTGKPVLFSLVETGILEVSADCLVKITFS